MIRRWKSPLNASLNISLKMALKCVLRMMLIAKARTMMRAALMIKSIILRGNWYKLGVMRLFPIVGLDREKLVIDRRL